jgi:hypothetical protein
MRRLALVVVALSFATMAHAQTYWHSDGQGYSTRVGNTVFQHRNGQSSTHTRAGNYHYHNYSNGLQGTQYYAPGGRFDNWSNPNQGWSGSGYTPYQNQYSNPYGGYGNTYRRYPH